MEGRATRAAQGGVMDSNAFRAALTKIMPGYAWTVHRASKGATRLVATGTQSSGFNRLSTLEVTYSRTEQGERFTARSAGHGLRARWLHENSDATLARALRGLQEHYQRKAATYNGHARALQKGRSA